MTKFHASIPFTVALFFAAPLIAPVAGAQDAGAENELVIEEIIVTARKREESLLDAPLTVTAFSADDIQKMAWTNCPILSISRRVSTIRSTRSAGAGASIAV